MQKTDGGFMPLHQGDFAILRAMGPEGPFTLSFMTKNGELIFWPNGDDKFMVPDEITFAYMLQMLEATTGLTVRIVRLDDEVINDKEPVPNEMRLSAKVRTYLLVL